MKIRHSIGFIPVYIVTLALCSSVDIYKNTHLSSRIVQTRNGRLQGIILPLDTFKFLKPIEAFLGVPYATPPVKSNSSLRYAEHLLGEHNTQGPMEQGKQLRPPRTEP
ncbi:COesterase domain-containing protein [Sergentomyia squamirostris]